VLIDQVEDLQATLKGVEKLETKDESPATPCTASDQGSMRSFSGVTRHLIVKDFDSGTTLEGIKTVLSKAELEYGYVSLRNDTVEVLLDKDSDAFQIYQFFDGLESFGKEIKVFDALPVEEEQLRRRRLRVSNIDNHFPISDMEDRFYHPNCVESIHFSHSSLGKFQGIATVTCFDIREADRVKDLFDKQIYEGRHLRVERLYEW